MKTTLQSLLICLLFACSANAQFVDWAKDQTGFSAGNWDIFSYYIPQQAPKIKATNTGILSAWAWEGVGYQFAKHDSVGNVVWSKGGFSQTGVGTTFAHVYISGYGEDSLENAYFTGSYAHILVLDQQLVLTQPKPDDNYGFLLKFDENGVLQFAKNIPEASSAAIDAGGNIYLTGRISDTITIGNQTVPGHFLNYHNFYIAKYDSAGNGQWLLTAENGLEHYNLHLRTLPNNDVVLFGNYSDSLIIKNNNTPVLTVSQGEGSFLARIKPNGTLAWHKQIDMAAPFGGYHLSVAPDTSIYIFGQFNGNLTFDNQTLTADTSRSDEFFLLKADGNGNRQWQKKMILDPQKVKVTDLRTDQLSNVLFTGAFLDSFALDQEKVYAINQGGFVAGLSATGHGSWLRTIPGSDVNALNSVTTNPNNEMFVSGYYFDSLYTQADTMVSGNGKLCICRPPLYATYLAKVNAPAMVASRPKQLHPQTQLYLYPNPASESFIIEAELEKPQPVTLHLRNLLGQQLQQTDLGNRQKIQHKINVQSLPKGVYMLQLQAGSEIVTQRVVVE